MQETITLAEVLEKMNMKTGSGRFRSFNCVCLTYSEKGDLGLPRFYKNATLAARGHKSAVIKDPNHHENFTRNIKVDGEYKKLHIRLLTHFNGKIVVW